MSFLALPITEPFWLLLAGLVILISASMVQLRLARKDKVESREIK